MCQGKGLQTLDFSGGHVDEHLVVAPAFFSEVVG
jgi:hypothetical protein